MKLSRWLGSFQKIELLVLPSSHLESTVVQMSPSNHQAAPGPPLSSLLFAVMPPSDPALWSFFPGELPAALASILWE